ncbi:integrase [Gossypium australe]|uniref:Integrase n=1 Tax=Gossypium australe TaxID=47621 RepID=A0A5B6WZX8_9ROSI|nr:integrase [Gossypium australe]
MDFVLGLSLSLRKKDAVWVIVDRLTKSTYFIPVRIDYSLQKLEELLHGVPLSILFYRDPRFTFKFWGKLHEALGTKLDFKTKDKVRVIWDCLKAASDHHKSYANLKRKEIEF